MKKIARIILILASSAVFSACGTTYFVDPIPTPTFTEPWQGEVQGSIGLYGRMHFEAACSLPENIAVVLNRETFTSGMTDDQEATSIAVGHFWTKDTNDPSLQILAGFGLGSHRVGPNFEYSEFQGFMSAPSKIVPQEAASFGTHSLLTGTIDFRKYFIEFEYPYYSDKNVTVGVASRLQYTHLYRYHVSGEIFSYPSYTTTDTSYFTDDMPEHNMSLDLGAFASMRFVLFDISPFELYTQILFSIPISGTAGRDAWDPFGAYAGVRLAF